jgi:hypothetical protein
MRKKLSFNLIAIAVFTALIFTLGCKRTEITETPNTPNTPPTTNPIGSVVNDATQVTASVSGIVLDENNVPIANAVVTSGTTTTTTNSNGMFIFQNISLSKENGNITAVKAGYFKGVRSFKTTEGKNHSVRLQLMQRTLSGTVNAAAGGTINANGGATIVFPANAFVTSTGAAYTGTVNIYSRWIDPTAANLPFVIPGDLRGVSTTGVENILETYGMVGAELTDANGNVLKIAPGKTATIRFPIPASLNATAPASIALWHFDEATARWKENGTATKTGNIYTAQVDKFSFWNADAPNANFINLDYTLINATTNTPLVSTSTKIKRVANGSYGYGVTNSSGFVSGLVPRNEALVLEVTTISGCNTIVYSQNIGPLAVSTSLGNINIAIPSSQFVNFTGTLTNCNGAAVTNGYVSLAATGGYGAFGNTNATGVFSFSVLNCTGSGIASYTYQGLDNTTGQQSTLLSGINANITVNLGTIVACSIAGVTDVYVAGVEGTAKVWKNGVVTNLSNAVDSSAAFSVFVSGNDVYVAGYERKFAKLWKNGVGTNLTNGTGDAEANSVFVVGNDVYVVGSERTIVNNNIGQFAKLWKNGIETNLTTSGFESNAKSVYVVGSDVYVAGYQSNINGQLTAKYWKNGIEFNLTNGIYLATATGIFVQGSNIYVSGTEYNSSGNRIAKFWKNGVASNLSTGSFGFCSSIFVSGSDVYVTGSEENLSGVQTAKVWKNGVPINLSNGTINSYANSVFLKGIDVYTTGSSYANNTQSSTVWKNGLLSSFFNASNTVRTHSIFVK